MDRRQFLRTLGLGAAATAAILVPGTEAWAELAQSMEPRRRWWQGWGGPQQGIPIYIAEGPPAAGLWIDSGNTTFITTQAQIQEHIRAWERSAVVHVRFSSDGWKVVNP